MRNKIYLMKMLSKRTLPFATNSSTVMETEDFREYVGTHGYHMTDSLADHVSSRVMIRRNAPNAWTTNDVKSAMKAYGLMDKCPDGVWWGDVSYFANQGRADLYPEVLKTDKECLVYAKMMIEDVDGYPEMAFMNFVANLIGKGDNVEWDKFI